MLKQVLAVLLALLTLVLPAIADESADYPLFQALSKWREWNPEILPARIAAVNAALARGANPGAVDENGMSGLHYAAAMGIPELAQAMLAGGAAPDLRDKRGRTPLLIAAEYSGFTWNHPEVIRLLLARGADYNSSDNEGFSVLLRAAGNPDTQVIAALFAAMPPLDPQGELAGSLLLEAARTRNNGVVSFLYAHGAALDAIDNDGRTVLMRALPLVDFPSLQHLVKAAPAGWRINRRGPKSWTALMMAARTCDLPTVTLLVDAGAALDPEDRKCLCALDHAAASNHADRDRIVAMLEARGAPHGIGHWFNLMLGTAIVLLMISAALMRIALKRK